MCRRHPIAIVHALRPFQRTSHLDAYESHIKFHISEDVWNWSSFGGNSNSKKSKSTWVSVDANKRVNHSDWLAVSIVRSLVLVGGDPGVGKSTLMLQSDTVSSGAVQDWVQGKTGSSSQPSIEKLVKKGQDLVVAKLEGRTVELGAFEMSSSGLKALKNPSEIFVSDGYSDSEFLAVQSVIYTWVFYLPLLFTLIHYTGKREIENPSFSSTETVDDSSSTKRKCNEDGESGDRQCLGCFVWLDIVAFPSALIERVSLQLNRFMAIFSVHNLFSDV
ncbi:hypothetical protein QVD17_32024 [Tagetes erecta]|uniref:Uncharacterized protein n=1 Tax=Tagetes erecta TaxID=13708 RepID=A0AAD8NHL2_TARER|nr:hypothetical protein QVD17_32024 [Tagetes erecta]